MKKESRFCCFIFILVFSPCIQSQDLTFTKKTFTTTEGLSNNNVRCIAQDKYGFLWIGTYDGLCRFDGLEFKRYYCDPNDPASLTYSQINYIAVDKNNNVWVVGNALSRYDRSSDKFVRMDKKRYGSAFSENVGGVVTDTAGNLFISANNGIYSYDYVADSLAEVPVYNKNGQKLSCRYDYFDIDRGNSFWFINYKTSSSFRLIVKRDSTNPVKLSLWVTGQFRSEISPIPGPVFENHIYVLPTKNGRIWFMSNDGVYLKPEKSDLIRKAKKKEINAHEFKSYRSACWSDKEGGINILFPDKNKLVNIPCSDIRHPQTIFQDKDGNFWCGNLDPYENGLGLQQFIFHFTGFQYYPDHLLKEYRNLAVYPIFKNNNHETFLGARNFPYILRVDSKGRVEKTNPPGIKPGNLVYQPRAFLMDNHDRLWVGYLTKIIRRYDPVTRAFKDINLKPSIHYPNVDQPSFRFLSQANNGKIISGGIGSLILFDPDSLSVSAFKFIPHDIYSVYHDEKDNFLLGSSGKLLVYNNRLNPVDSFNIGDVGFNIESICKDDSIHLWLGLLKGGLCRLNLVNRHVEFFTMKNGLANNTVYNILKDPRAKLWMSTDEGISVFNPATRNFFNYDESNGLYIREFNADAVFLTKDGEMLFGGMGGAVGFYPEQLEQKNKQNNTRLILTGLQYRFKNHDTIAYLNERKSLLLPAGTKNLQVTFSCIDFQNQKKTHFRYRLSGLNDEWEEFQNQSRTINLMSLSPGNYNFEIQATNLNGEWWETASLMITIPFFFYETILFKILSGFTIVIITGAFVYMRIRQFRLRQKNRLTELKLSTLQGQINPHFLSNSLEAVDSFIASNDPVKANLYLGELRDMMRDMIDYTGKEYIPMEDEINLLKRYLKAEQTRTEYLFSFEILAGDIDISNVLLAPSMIQPFAENAIKHAFTGPDNRKGRITITFRRESSGLLSCVIEDNGVGRKHSAGRNPSVKRKSRGIELIKERLAIFNKINKTRLTLHTEDIFPGEIFPGTRVILQIPCKFIS